MQLGAALFLEQEGIFDQSDDEVVAAPGGNIVEIGRNPVTCTISASPLSEPASGTKAEAVLIAAGRVLALSWYREEPLGVSLSPAMCKLLLGRDDLIEWTDLSSVIPSRQFRVLEECMAAKPADKKASAAKDGGASTAVEAAVAADVGGTADAGADAGAVDAVASMDAGAGAGDAIVGAGAGAGAGQSTSDRIALFTKFKMWVFEAAPSSDQHFVMPSRAARRAAEEEIRRGCGVSGDGAAIVAAIRRAQGKKKSRITLSELHGTVAEAASSGAGSAAVFREDSALYDGSEETMVTENNVDGFVQAWTEKELVTNTVEQVRLMQKGIREVEPPYNCELLTLLPDDDSHGVVVLGELGDDGWKQFQHAIRGSNEIDVDEWKEQTDVVHNSLPDGPVAAALFWELARALSHGLRRKLLIYWCSKLPPAGGLKMLRCKLKLVMTPPDRSSLPTAHTCFGTMEVPATTSREKMQEVIAIAIAHCFQFGDER